MKTPGTYVDGFLLPIPQAKLEDYRAIAQKAAAIWREYGALQYTECALDDADPGPCRAFAAAANAQAGDTVIFAWAVFADRAARDAANAKIMADERLAAMCSATSGIFDCKTMAFGGFKVIVAH